MKVKDFLEQVRIGLNDIDAFEFSNNELVNYLNFAQDWIVNQLIILESPLIIKSVDLSNCLNGATLPNDFVKEHSVVSGNYILHSIATPQVPNQFSYKILGHKLYSGNENVTLYYFYRPPCYQSLDDNLFLPNYFGHLLYEIVVFLGKKRIEVGNQAEATLSKVYMDQLLQVVSGISGQNFVRPIPFMV